MGERGGRERWERERVMDLTMMSRVGGFFFLHFLLFFFIITIISLYIQLP